MMYSDNMNGISIEQFAAFLDGNLPDAEMEETAMAIDSSEEYSGILGEVMHLDDSVEAYMNQPEILQDEVPVMDFDLPVVPVLAGISDSVELSVASTEETGIGETEDVRLALVSENADNTDEIDASHLEESPITASDDVCDMGQQSDEIIDLGDFA